MGGDWFKRMTAIPVPPSSDTIAPPLAVDNDNIHLDSKQLDSSLQLPQRKKPYQRAAIEEILCEKIRLEEKKYTVGSIKQPALIPGYKRRPHSADTTLQRQQLLQNIKNEFDNRNKPSEQNAFVEKFTLKHFGVKIETEKIAASFNKKSLRPKTSYPRTAHNTSNTSNNSTNNSSVSNSSSNSNSVLRKIFERHMRSAQRSADRKAALRPLEKHSETTNESYLRFLATKQQQRVTAGDVSSHSRDPNNSNSGCDSKIFNEFKSFCDNIKSRAKEAGREADVQSVDDAETQRVLFKKYLTHHYNAAREEFQPPDDDEDASTTASFEQQQRGIPKKNIFNSKKSKVSLDNPSKLKVTKTNKSAPQQHALLMNARDKQGAMHNLLERQFLVSYITERLGQLQAVTPEEGTEEEVTIKEEIKRLFQTKKEALIRAGLSRRNPSEAPSERTKRLLKEIQLESQQQLFHMIESYTLDHFSVLQRQQTRHQNHARLLFNRAPTGMRKNIISLRQNRIEKQGNSRSACLLFMPPPESIKKPNSKTVLKHPIPTVSHQVMPPTNSVL